MDQEVLTILLSFNAWELGLKLIIFIMMEVCKERLIRGFAVFPILKVAMFAGCSFNVFCNPQQG